MGYLTPGTAPDILRVISPPPVEGDIRDAADLAVFRMYAPPRRQPTVGDGASRQSAWHRHAAADLQLRARCVDYADRRARAGAAPLTGRGRRRRGVVQRQEHVEAKRPTSARRVRWPAARGQRTAGAGELDYPPGHATAGWMAGRLLAEVAPDRATEVLERARKFGESRVVCGVHHVTAVEAGFMTAESVLSALHGVAAFRSDPSLRARRCRALAIHQPSAQVCAADAAALSERPGPRVERLR